ncbi:MAG: GLUG motif-containing protein [Nanoarchaeota archaeon]
MDRISQINFLKSFVIILLLFVGIVFAFQGGDGTIGDPFQISSCTELQNMSSCLSCHYILNNDVDCGDTKNWNYNGSVYQGFIPVGNCTGDCFSDGDDYWFNGSFDGKNKIIDGLFINRSNRDGVGLFGVIRDNSIKNLGLTNVQISGNNDIGGLVGGNFYGNIDNSYSNGDVNGNNDIGGLVGVNYGGNITNSYSNGNIYGNNYIGGLVGVNFYGNITNSYSSGDVNGNNDIGGIGGLVGHNFYGNIDNSYSNSNVNGNNGVGGLFGANFYGNISNSYSSGYVNGNNYIGGLFGVNYYGNIDNSYSSGYVNGNSSVGGLVGLTSGNINNSFTVSSINGTNSSFGGLIGEYFSGIIANTYWLNTSFNVNHSIGNGSTTGIFTNDSLSYFYDCSNEPMTSWNYTDIWDCNENNFPTLKWQDVTFFSPETPSDNSSNTSIYISESIFPAFSFLSILFSMITIVGWLIFA